MGYTLSIDEIQESYLIAEIGLRAQRRAEGRCDYCDRRPSTIPCKYTVRHGDVRIGPSEACHACEGSGRNEENSTWCRGCQGRGVA